MVQHIKDLNREKYDYGEFLKKFTVRQEVCKIDMDQFDYNFYAYGLEQYGDVALVEPLEYKEERKLREFVIAIDTSGSVQGSLVQAFLRKTYNIMFDSIIGRNLNIYIIQCDANIQEAVCIHSKEEFEAYIKSMVLKGFGGTDFRPVFEFVNKKVKDKEFTNLKGLIYFTDGYGIFPKTKQEYDTAFVFVNENNDPNFEPPEVPPWAIKLILEGRDI
jgi:predicted metal-dependent peptidase